jgi:hypothetical protein
MEAQDKNLCKQWWRNSESASRFTVREARARSAFLDRVSPGLHYLVRDVLDLACPDQDYYPVSGAHGARRMEKNIPMLQGAQSR